MGFGSLTYLLVPFFTGLATFTLAIFNNVEGVNIEAMNIPAEVTGKTGYTSPVVIKRLADRMKDIEEQAQSRADGKKVMAQDDGGSAAILGQYFGLSSLLKVVQTSFGLIPYTLAGEVVINGKSMNMIIRGSDNTTSHTTIIKTSAPVGDFSGLIDQSAYEAVRMIDPALLAAYQFKRDYLTRNFTLTEDVIRRALASEDQRSRKWVLNLWGVVLYQQSDFDGAIEKFRQAIDLDPAFTASLLNWGVVLARQGKQEEAIGKYIRVVESWRRGNPSDTLAAAYSEWGFSLALLGRTRDAITKFQTASQVDPTFSDVYSSWAEVLSASGRSDDAQKMTKRALELAPVERVYTDNLIGRIQQLPAVASSR
ncbi:MAG: tetratricopeptide repeat protein [Rhodospirillaceae bacterium]